MLCIRRIALIMSAPPAILIGPWLPRPFRARQRKWGGRQMPRRSIPVVATFLCAATAWPAFAQERPATSPVAAVVDTLAGGLMARSECVGVAVGVDHGGMQGFYAYGEVERGSGRRP
jgi:hypothetical protein